MERPPEPPHVVGDYRLVHPLGEGGMGSVWLAEHIVLGKRFAIKLLLRENTNNADVRARFEQEARTIGGLDHPNVVSATHFGFTAEGHPYLVMEALRGQSLRSLFDRIVAGTGRPMPPRRAVDLIRQACAGIAHAHERGIIHRDLKPENLFVTQAHLGTDQVKVLDFGIAKIRGAAMTSSHKTQTGMVLGTPYYMSFEQARGESDIDFRTDIYSLAAILYELVSTQKPHDGEQYNALLADIIARDPTSLDEQALGLPSGLSDVILRGMSRDREKRYQTVVEFDQALGAFCEWPTVPAAIGSVPAVDLVGSVNTVVVPTPIGPHADPAPQISKSTPDPNVRSIGPAANAPSRRSTWPFVVVGLGLIGIGGATWLHRSSPPAVSHAPSSVSLSAAMVTAAIATSANSQPETPTLTPVIVTPVASTSASVQLSAGGLPSGNPSPGKDHPPEATPRATATAATAVSAPERKSSRVSEATTSTSNRRRPEVTVRVPQNPYQ